MANVSWTFVQLYRATQGQHLATMLLAAEELEMTDEPHVPLGG